MFYSHQKNQNAPLFSLRRENEIVDPFWEDYERSQRLKASVAYLSANPATELQELVAALKTVARILASWIFKFPLLMAKAAAEGMSLTAQTVAVPIELVWKAAPEIRDRLKDHIRSPEFWLGVGFGAATRLATKLAIMAAFASAPRLATAASFIACAAAGLAAGVVTHLVRTLYRNARAAQGEARESYFGRALFESAVVGIVGGLCGGTVANAGAVIARAGSFAAGASAGVAAGVLQASVKGYKTAAGRRPEKGWRKMAFRSIAFGALGGVLGVLSAELFGAHTSLAAAPSGEAGSVIYVPPSTNPYMLENCATDYCGLPSAPHLPPAVLVEPLHPAPVQTVTVVMQEPSPPEATPALPVHHAPAVVHHNPCRTTVKHHHHVKHVAHAKPPPQIVEKVVIIQQPVPPMPPPQVIAPPRAVVPLRPIDPCETGLCADPCPSSSQLDLKGPCADPNMPCVEKVSFNAKGEATKVVLEPRAGKMPAGPHFEIGSSQETKVASWSMAQGGAIHATDTAPAPDASKVALVMPFAGRAATASPAPV